MRVNNDERKYPVMWIGIALIIVAVFVSLSISPLNKPMA